MDLQIEGKKAVVTGGSRGIGKAIARALAAEGAHVAIVARTRGPVEAAAAELVAETGGIIVPLVADTRDDDSVQRMAVEAVRQLGQIDILVNNAARPSGGPGPGLDGIEEAGFHEEMSTKVLGYVRCARAFAPGMKEKGWGRIINISGLAARLSGNAVGSIRNVAVAALSKNLADELGPFGINVTVVHPGLTWTERMPALLEARARELGVTVEAAREQLTGANAIRRIVSADDIGAIVAFLASPRSVAITGDAIAAGGGVGPAIHY